ncbi:MAG: hypothetical protein ABI456_02385 [Ktedonobacteraceae bacterium]|nr:hypothetical protein [Chloroflexota bacterium]
MIAPKGLKKEDAAVREAIRLLAQHGANTATHHWVCEVCGMPHTGARPACCDSCGSHTAIVPQRDLRFEMGSRW